VGKGEFIFKSKSEGGGLFFSTGGGEGIEKGKRRISFKKIF